jgi:hypothetical protein
VSKGQQWHEIVANALIAVLVAMAGLIFSIVTEFYSTFDFLYVPATYVVPVGNQTRTYR